MTLDNMGLEEFFSAMASSLSDDEDKRLLIREGLKIFYLGRTERPGLPINQTTSTRFFLDVSTTGAAVLWDYYTLSMYMASVEFSPMGCIVGNARTGQAIHLPPDAASGFFRYLVECIPGFEDHCRKNGVTR